MALGAAFFVTVPLAHAEMFKSAAECVVGRRVADKDGNAGKVIGINRWQSVNCDVQMDKTGERRTFIFWMLHAEGESPETNDKLVNGTYPCYAGLPVQYTFMDIHITSPNTYDTSAGRGKFHVDPSRKIVFESGPLAKYTAKLDAGPTIKLNQDGGRFYGTTCGLHK